MTMSTSWEPLPSTYRSKQEFLASLPRWRRLLQTLNWHPTIDKKVQQYELEQRILQEEKAIERLKSESLRVRSETEQIEREIVQIEKENARLSELNGKLDAIVFSSPTSSTPAKPTPSESEM
jgi:hypothetical protein